MCNYVFCEPPPEPDFPTGRREIMVLSLTISRITKCSVLLPALNDFFIIKAADIIRKWFAGGKRAEGGRRILDALGFVISEYGLPESSKWNWSRKLILITRWIRAWGERSEPWNDQMLRLVAWTRSTKDNWATNVRTIDYIQPQSLTYLQRY